MEEEKVKKGFGITSMVLGIISILFCWHLFLGGVLATLAIVFGIPGIVKKRGKGMAIAGLICGGIALLVTVFSIPLNAINSINNTIPYTTTTTSTNSNIKEEKIKKEVIIPDFSVMTKDETTAWFNDNNINGKIIYDYSDTVAKDGFVSQSILANMVAYENDRITVTYSLGKKPTIGQKNALKKAESYSSLMNMSKKSIYRQLTSEYGEGFTAEEAQYAIDNINADWNYNALEKAKSYQETLNMSKNNIYRQLTSEYGEGFTAEEAQYAIDHLED